MAVSGAAIAVVIVVLAARSISRTEASRTGSFILFESRARDRPSALLVMNTDGTGLRRLRTSGRSPGNASWSPDGKRIAYDVLEPNGLIVYVINADGSGKRRVAMNAHHADWSPNGREIVFQSGWETGIVDARTFQRRLTFDMETVNPAWSPDGKQIAFGDTRSDGNGSSIWVVNADGSGLHDLDPGGARRYFHNSRDADWSPDGKRIAFTVGREGCCVAVAVMNADGSGRRVLTTDGKSLSPSWSPDGSRITYESRGQILVMNADGTDKRQLTHDNRSNSQPVWSPP